MSTSSLEAKLGGDGLFNTEPYHLEKYIVPGAIAVTILFIFPWYILGGNPLRGVDLGTTIIAVLVVGHVIESLKVYQWGRAVRENYRHFNAKVEGLLHATLNKKEVQEEQIEQAKTILFTQLNSSESSEFAWNLVRWQKMTVFAVILFFSAIQWFSFVILAILERFNYNPFAASFKVTLLRDGSPLWGSYIVDLILCAAMFLTACFVYKYGKSRQVRNNDFYFRLFFKYKEGIIQQLKEGNNKGEKNEAS